MGNGISSPKRKEKKGKDANAQTKSSLQKQALTAAATAESGTTTKKQVEAPSKEAEPEPKAWIPKPNREEKEREVESKSQSDAQNEAELQREPEPELKPWAYRPSPEVVRKKSPYKNDRQKPERPAAKAGARGHKHKDKRGNSSTDDISSGDLLTEKTSESRDDRSYDDLSTRDLLSQKKPASRDDSSYDDLSTRDLLSQKKPARRDDRSYGDLSTSTVDLGSPKKPASDDGGHDESNIDLWSQQNSTTRDDSSYDDLSTRDLLSQKKPASQPGPQSRASELLSQFAPDKRGKKKRKKTASGKKSGRKTSRATKYPVTSMSVGGLQALLCKRVPQPRGVTIRYLKKLAKKEGGKRSFKHVFKRVVLPALAKLRGPNNSMLDTMSKDELNKYSGLATHAVSYCPDISLADMIEALIAAQSGGTEGVCASIHATTYSTQPEKKPVSKGYVNCFFYIDVFCAPNGSYPKSTREIFEWRNAFEHVPRVLMVVADDGQGGDYPEGGHPNGLRVLTHLQNLTEALLALARGVELQLAFVPRVWTQWVTKVSGHLSSPQALAEIARWWDVDVKKAKCNSSDHQDMLRSSFWTKPRQGKVLLLQSGIRGAFITRLATLVRSKDPAQQEKWRPLLCQLLRRFWRYDEAHQCYATTVKAMTEQHGPGAQETLRALVGHSDTLMLLGCEEGDTLYQHMTRTADERVALQTLVQMDTSTETMAACLGVRRAMLQHERFRRWLWARRQTADAAQVLRTIHAVHHDIQFSLTILDPDHKHAHEEAYTESQHDAHMLCTRLSPCGASGRSGFETYTGQPSSPMSCRGQLAVVVQWLLGAKEALEHMLSLDDSNDIDVDEMAALVDDSWKLPDAVSMDDRCNALLCRNVLAFSQLRDAFPEQLAAETNPTELNIGGLLRAKVRISYPVLERSRTTALAPAVKSMIKALKGEAKIKSEFESVPVAEGLTAVVNFMANRIASLNGHVSTQHVLWLEASVDLAALLLARDSTIQHKLARDVLKAVRPLLDTLIRNDAKSAKTPGGDGPLHVGRCSAASRLKCRCMRILGYSLSRSEWLSKANTVPSLQHSKKSPWRRLKQLRSCCAPPHACILQLHADTEARPLNMLREATEAVVTDPRVEDSEPEDKGLKLLRQACQNVQEVMDPQDPSAVEAMEAYAQCLLWRASGLIRGATPALKFSLEECQLVACAKLALMKAANLMRRSCASRVRRLGLRHSGSICAALQLSLTLACDHERRSATTPMLRSTFGFATSTQVGEALLLQTQHALASVLVMDNRLDDAKAVLQEAIGMDHSATNIIQKSSDPAPRNSLPLDVLALQMADVHLRLKEFDFAAQWYRQVLVFVPVPDAKDTSAQARAIRLHRAQVTAASCVCMGMQYHKHIRPDHPDTALPPRVEKQMLSAIASLEQSLTQMDKAWALSNLNPEMLRMLWLQMSILVDVRKWEDHNNGLQQMVDAMKKYSKNDSTFRWQSPTFLKAMECLFNSYVDFGELDPALPLLNELLGLHKEILKAVEDDAVLMQNKSDREVILQTANSKVASLLQTLGGMYMDLGKFTEAEKHMKNTLTLMEANHEHTSMMVLGVVNQLAVLLKKSKRFAESQHFYERALNGYREATGEDSDATLVVLTNLANLLVDMGDYAKAHDHYATALEATETRYGLEHQEYYLCMFGFAKLCIKARQYGEAEEMLEKVKIGFDKAYSSFDIKFSMFAEAESDLKSAQGDDIIAEKLLRKALSGYEERLSMNHPDTLRASHKLATILSNKAQLNPFKAKTYMEEANSLYRRTLNEYFAIHGPLHPDSVSILKLLATDEYESRRLRDPNLLKKIQNLSDQNQLEGESEDARVSRAIAEELFKWINGEVEYPNVKDPPKAKSTARPRAGTRSRAHSRSRAILSRESDSGSDLDVPARPKPSRGRRTRSRTSSIADSDSDVPARPKPSRGRRTRSRTSSIADSDSERRSRSRSMSPEPSRRPDLRDERSTLSIASFHASQSDSDSDDPRRSPRDDGNTSPTSLDWTSNQIRQLRRAVRRYNSSYDGPELSKKEKWGRISEDVHGKTARECYLEFCRSK